MNITMPIIFDTEEKIDMNKSKSLRIFASAFFTLLLIMLYTIPVWGDLLDPPGPEHLAQTMECEWSVLSGTNTPDPEDDLVKLAGSLENNPVKIYRWVHRNIEHDETYSGSRLGAKVTYLTKRGNSLDTSSLLIALLRISNIPAQYVYNSSRKYAYVEAWLPVDNYRGNGLGSEKGWVALIPWHKSKTVEEGIDLFPDGTVPSELSFDFDEYLETINFKTPIELFEGKVQKYLSETFPGKTLNDVPFKNNVVYTDAVILPSSLPKDLSTWGTIVRFADIPFPERINITLSYDRKEGSSTINLLTRKIYLPEVAGKRFCLDFIPATESDRITIENNGGMCTQGAANSGASVRPVLKVDGVIMPETIVDGTIISEAIGEPIQLGESIYPSYVGGGYRNTPRPQWQAGVFTQMAFDPIATSPQRIEKLKKELLDLPTSLAEEDSTREEYLGRMASILLETYLLRLFEAQSKAENLFYGNLDRGVSPTFMYTFPSNMYKDRESKFFIHPQWNIDSQISGAFSRYFGNDKVYIPWTDPLYKTLRDFYMYSASYNEGRIFEDWFETEGLSTVKGIMVAHRDNIPVQAFIKTENDENGHIAQLNALKYATNLNPTSITDAQWGLIRSKMIEYGMITSSITQANVRYWFVDANPRTSLTEINRILREVGLIPSDALDDSTIDTVLGFLDDGDTVTLPITLLDYEGMKGYVMLTEGPTSDGYLFNMNYGGKNSPWTSFNNSYQDWDPPVSTPPQISDNYSKYVTMDTNYNPLSYEIPDNFTFADISPMGDPVNMVNGEYYQQEKPDLLLKSTGFNLSVVRKYKSKLSYNGLFGFGWTWNHAEILIPLDNGEIKYYNQESDAITIIDNGDGTYSYPPGATFTLTQVDDINGKYLITENKTQNKSYFSADGFLLKKVDPFGNTLTFNYTDTENIDRITEIEDDLGRKLTFTYNTNGKVEKATDFSGRYCEYVYSGDDLVEFIDLESNVTKYEYLSDQENPFNDHNMSKYILPNGDWLEIGYYLNDTVAYHTNKKGETFNFMYSRLNQYAETWNEEGYYRKLFYNENNDVVRLAKEDGTIESMEYDQYHNKVSHTDGNGFTTTFQFYPDGTPADQQDALSAQRKLYVKTNALTQSSRYSYDSTNNPYAPSEIVDPNGNITLFVYNEDGSLDRKIQAPGYAHNAEGVLVQDPESEGIVTSFIYDDNGHVTRQTFPDGSFTQNTYDSDSLYLISKQDKKGHLVNFEYYTTCGTDRTEWEALGALKSKSVVQEDDTLLTTTFEYNLYGQVTKQTNPLGDFVSFQYDKNRKLTLKTDANGAQTLYEYDVARDIVSGAKLIKMTDPEGFVETYQYDKVGNRIAVTDKNGNTTQYVYDAMNRIIGQEDPLGFSKWMFYDGAGNVVEKVDKNGNTTRLEYDQANRLVKVTTPMGAELGYSSSIEYDANGNKTLEIDAEGIQTKYDYDGLNRLISKTNGYESFQPRTTLYRYNEANQLVAQIQPLGDLIRYEYDDAGKLAAEKAYDKDGTTLLRHSAVEYYADARNLVKTKSIIDGIQEEGVSNDVVEQFEYDELGRKAKYIDPQGSITKYTYDEVGNLVQSMDPLGNITLYTYDRNNRPTGTINAKGHKTTIQYDGLGNIILQIDAMDNETRYFYDAVNRKIGVQDALGKTTLHDYDANGNLLAITDPKGNETRNEYDEDNRLIATVNALGQQTSFSYYPSGRIQDQVSPENIITRKIYDDPMGQVTQLIQAFGSANETITGFAYDDNGLLEQETNALGIATSYIYDGLGRVLEKRIGLASDDTPTFPDGVSEAIIESFTYFPTGAVKTHLDPENQGVAYEYNGLGKKSKFTDAENNITRWEYGANGNLLAVRYPENISDTYAYDALNRLVQKVEQGVETAYEYNGNNQVTSETNGQQVDTIFVYDALNRLIEQTQGLMTPDQSTSIFGYDSNSNMVFITNSLGKTIFYEYDNLNRRVKETKAQDVDTSALDTDNLNLDAYSLAKQAAYDNDGNLYQVTRADNTQVIYDYDDLYRNTSVTVNGTLEQEFDYDALSRMTSATDHNSGGQSHTVEYDQYNLNHLPASEIQDGRLVGTSYDNNANLTTLAYSSGKSIQRTFTPNNLLETITNTTEGITLAQVTQYNGLNSLRSMTLANGLTLDIDYDEHNRETLRAYTVAGVNRYTHDIQNRDNQGNITSETITTFLETISKTHTYDDLDRISTSAVTNKPDAYWSYDTEGNWQETNQNGAVENRIVDNDNQYTVITGETPAYDANGNMTAHNGQTLAYDWSDRLTKVYESGTLTFEYEYDALNRRVRKIDRTSATPVTTEYVYNGKQVIEEYKDNILVKTFVYADYVDDPIAMTNSSGNRYYFVKDRQFNIKAVTDASGSIVESYEYSAFGVMTIYNSLNEDITASGSAIGNPYGYTGRRWDAETNLWYYRNRMYSPSIGRFMQKDPAGYVDGLNLYAYVKNNPLMYLDPMGLTAIEQANTSMLPSGAESVTATYWNGVQENAVEEGNYLKYAFGGVMGTLGNIGHSIDKTVTAMWNDPEGALTGATKGIVNLGPDLFNSAVNLTKTSIDGWTMLAETTVVSEGTFADFRDTSAYNITPLLNYENKAEQGGAFLAQTALLVKASSAKATTAPKNTTALTKYEPWPKTPTSPHADGFLFGWRQAETAQKGQVFSRLGKTSGSYVAPPGTSLSARGLPAGYKGSESLWKATKPFSMESGLSAPWKGSTGMGIQHKLPQSIESLRKSGYLSPVK